MLRKLVTPDDGQGICPKQVDVAYNKCKNILLLVGGEIYVMTFKYVCNVT
jgi:hypothetical protein